MDERKLIEIFSENIDNELTKLNLKEVNIFNILKTERNEIRHSNFLAWLLNSKESHGLEDKILKSFIEQVININKERNNLKDILLNNIDYTSFKVEREVEHIDLLLVSTKNKIVICIENKIDSIEHEAGQTGKMQTDEYVEKIDKIGFEGYEKIFIYLTAFNEKPNNDKWILIDYQIIYDILNKVLKREKISDEVKYVIECYVEVLKMSFVEDPEFKKVCQEIYKKYNTIWQIIQKNANTHVETLRGDILKYLKELEENKQLEICYESDKWLCFTTEKIKKEFNIIEDEIFFTIGFIKDENMILFILENKFATIADEKVKENLLSLWWGKMRTKAQKKLRNIKIEEENIEKTKKDIKAEIDFILENEIDKIIKRHRN